MARHVRLWIFFRCGLPLLHASLQHTSTSAHTSNPTLVVAAGECFYLALMLERAFAAQLKILSTTSPYHIPETEEARRWGRLYEDDPFNGGHYGEQLWPAMVKKALRLSPDLSQ